MSRKSRGGDARKWSVRQFLAELVELFEAKGYDVLPNQFALRNSEQWRSGAEQALAWCEMSGVSPRDLIRCHSETVGYMCHANGQRMWPGMLYGDKAADRYDRWLRRQHDLAHTVEAGFSPKTDLGVRAETAYIEVLGAHVLYRGSTREGRQNARKAATQVLGSRYTPCSSRRIIALCDYLHRVHPTLPDSIQITGTWKVSEILKIAFRLTT